MSAAPDAAVLAREVPASCGDPMIRPCREVDTATILEIVNDAAEAYRGVIPGDRWREPYMSRTELEGELRAGVRFWARVDGGRMVAVMGLQDVLDVSLVRHAYTRTDDQGRGHGSALLAHVRSRTRRPMLIGTWRAAVWAIRFYRGHGFEVLDDALAQVMLRRYWCVPEEQMGASVVLAEAPGGAV